MREDPGLWPVGKQVAGLKGPASSVKAPWLPLWFQPLSYPKWTGEIALGSWQLVGRPLSAKPGLSLWGDAGRQTSQNQKQLLQVQRSLSGPWRWRFHQCLYTGENKLTFFPCQSKNLL